jgi:hypothetical protein
VTREDALDRQPALSGYQITAASGETFHVWPETCVVVSELAGEPVAIGVDGSAAIALTDASVHTLQHIWAAVLARWRSRRRL